MRMFLVFLLSSVLCFAQTRTFTPTLRQNSSVPLTTIQVDGNFTGIANTANGAARSYFAGSQAAMLALSPSPLAGDLCWRSDISAVYIFLGGDPTSVANWATWALNVVSVFGRTGPVTAQAGDYTAAQVGFVQAGAGAVAQTSQDKMRGSVSLKDYGAVGDGSTDDTAAIQVAVVSCPAGMWLDGLGLTYKITGTITSSRAVFALRNAKFVMGTAWSEHGQFTLTGSTTLLDNITVDGGRGTYKIGNEPWTVFSSFNGYNSIQPTLDAIFRITNFPDQAARTVIERVNLYNIHSVHGIRVATYGSVFINNCDFSNCSNGNYYVVHSPDSGVTQYGGTVASNIRAKDLGILPTTFTIDSVVTNRATTTGLPQGAFGLIVSYGDYSISNAVVDGYGSTGVTADINKTFNASNVTIRNTNAAAMSNNPSGAFWLERPAYANVSNLTVDIQDRDPRDTALESSAVQIYATDGQAVNFSGLNILGNASSAKLDRGIRSSVLDGAAVEISNFKVNGLYASWAFDFAIFNSTIGSKVHLTNGVMNTTSGIRAVRPGTFTMDKVHTAGSISIADIATSNTCDNVFITNSSFVNFVNSTTITKTLGISSCDFSGSITRGTVSGHDVGSEYGTWTPVLEGTTGSVGSYAVSIAAGNWIKTGGVVHFQARIVLTNKGSWTGNVKITGLPFPANGSYSPVNLVADWVTLSSGMGQLSGVVANGDSFFTVTQSGTGAASVDLPMSGVANNTAFLISGSYNL